MISFASLSSLALATTVLATPETAAVAADTGLLATVKGYALLVLGFLLILSIVVFVHELGHFLVARFNKVRVDVFSIGFGPELIGFTDRHGTRWSLSALPFGGYVKFFGDDDASSGTADEAVLAEMTDEEKAVCFQHKTVFQRFAIVAAGPLSNFVLAIVIFWGIFVFHGQSRPEARIFAVLDGKPAAAAGLKAGDLIVEVNGDQVSWQQQVQRRILLSGDKPLSLKVDREGQILSFDLFAQSVVETDAIKNKVKLSQIGIQFVGRGQNGEDLVRLGPVEALGQGIAQTQSLVTDTFRFIGQMISGYRSTDELRGPITIARFSGKAMEQGLVGFLFFVALLSANLGLINLFPIPMLDGGHLVFYTFEAVRGRPLSDRVQEWLLRLGLAIVVFLMLYTTFNDVSSWWKADTPLVKENAGAPQ